MIEFTLNDVADVSFYLSVPVDPLSGDSAPAVPVMLFIDAAGNRCHIRLPGVASSAQAREAAAKARQWYIAAAERALAE